MLGVVCEEQNGNGFRSKDDAMAMTSAKKKTRSMPVPPIIRTKLITLRL
jgi:hypothetical protein